MTAPELTVSHGVIVEMVTRAALEIPGVARVARGGPRWLSFLAGPPVVTSLAEDGVRIRIWVIARPGQQVAALSDGVRSAVAAAVERLLGMRVAVVTVTVDGVGG